MKTILLTFDIEEFPAREFHVPIPIEEAYDIGYRGTNEIWNLLKENGVKATCFVTYAFAQRYESLIKKLEEAGCEIASHGFNHDHRYHKMSGTEALLYLKKSIDGLRKLGFQIHGFRAPQMSKPSDEIIEKAGFKYDSSLHPTWVPTYYNNFFKKRDVHDSPAGSKGLKIVPLSAAPLVRLPMGWFWFRNFGLTYEKVLTRLNWIDLDFINLYIHPWELVDIDNKLNRRHLSRFILRKTGDEFIHMLDQYIQWCKRRGYKFDTIRNYLGIK